MSRFSDSELCAFLDEALPPARSAQLEHELRTDLELRARLIEVRGRDTVGLHTIGAIWRRHRLSCPSRESLGQYLLGTLDDEATDYIRFHLDSIGCRYCQANLADLQEAQSATPQQSTRRQRYFQTSAGYLRKDFK
jgi:hypothetical protein